MSDSFHDSIARLAGTHRGVPWKELAEVTRSGASFTVIFHHRPQALLARLSEREQEVARLVAAGHRNRDIAEALGISIATTKDHVHHVLEKTGLSSRTELAAALAREGL